MPQMSPMLWSLLFLFFTLLFLFFNVLNFFNYSPNIKPQTMKTNSLNSQILNWKW